MSKDQLSINDEAEISRDANHHSSALFKLLPCHLTMHDADQRHSVN